MSRIIKNGKAYDGGDVKIAMFGSLNYEVTEISYDTEQEHQMNHSLGSNKGSSWSMGKIENNGSMTIRLASSSAIEKAVGGDILKIKPFDINVTFLNEYNDIINDTVTAKFTKQGRNVDGGMDVKMQYPLFVLDVDYNNA
jgi:hypothetical protein